MENIKNKEVTVLMVSDKDSDIRKTKENLENTMGVLCHIWHCSSVIRSSGFFKKKFSGIDIVLLDLDFVTSGHPEEIFRSMKEIVGDVPIIVFTAKEDHELALMVIEEGAADSVTSGQFETDPYKLRDAIEFAIARGKISKNIEIKNEANIVHLGKKMIADIEVMKEHQETILKESMASASVILKETIDRGKHDLMEATTAYRELSLSSAADIKAAIEAGEKNVLDAKEEAAVNLKELREAGVERQRKNDQIIHWMSGGYSMEKTPDPD